MKIELSCPACGGNRFALDKAEADESMVACGDCGREMGTLAALKQSVERMMSERERPNG